MSSILDALKKLEKEKDKDSLPPVPQTTPQADVPVQDPEGDVTLEDPSVALPVRERDQLMAHWISAAIILGSAVIGLFLMIGILGSSFLVARSGAGNPDEVPKVYQETQSPQVQPIAIQAGGVTSPATPPVSAPIVPVPPNDIIDHHVVQVGSSATAPSVPPDSLRTYLQTQSPGVTESTKAKPVPETPVSPSRLVKMVPIPAPGRTKKAVVPAPDKPRVYALKSIPMPKRFPAPATQVARKTPKNALPKTTPEKPVPPERATNVSVAELPKKPGPVESSVDLSALPGLNEADRIRWSLTGMQVNMPLPANKNRPIASAIINMKTVRIGERIPNSKAVLIAVDMRSIGIKVEETGQRFRVRF